MFFVCKSDHKRMVKKTWMRISGYAFVRMKIIKENITEKQRYCIEKVKPISKEKAFQ